MGQDYTARKKAKKQRKRAGRDAETGRKRKRRDGVGGVEVDGGGGGGDDDGLQLSAEQAKRKRKKGGGVPLRISRSLCYKEPHLTEADRAWDGGWEEDGGGGSGGGSGGGAAGFGALQGFKESGYDSDVEEQLAKLPPSQKQKQQKADAPSKQPKQPARKPKLSTGVILLDPRKAAKEAAARGGSGSGGQAQQQGGQQRRQEQLDAAVAASPALRAVAEGAHPLVARCLARLGHEEPTPVQRAAWPHALAGADLTGVSEPGSGKTLAYLLPALARLADSSGGDGGGGPREGLQQQQQKQEQQQEQQQEACAPWLLVLVPSRELAQQVHAQAAAVAGLAGARAAAVFGGVPRGPQAERLLAQRPAVLVATPGRLLDLADAGAVSLASVRCVVLDEADKMLSVGFEPQLQRLRSMVLPRPPRGSSGGGEAGAEAAVGGGGGARREKQQQGKKKQKRGDSAEAGAAGKGGGSGGGSGGSPRPQVLLFTATMPKALRATAAAWLAPGAPSVSCRAGAESISRTVTQVVHVCAEHKKPAKLLKHLNSIKEASAGLRNLPRVLVFANRIKTVAFIHRTLAAEGLRAVMLHGKRSQEERNAALADFKAGKAQVLVASDVASRGLDVRGLPFVVNYDFPSNLEAYVHRVGRTGRLAASGHAFSFFTRPMARLAGPVVELLQDHEQVVDPNLLALAEAWRQAEEALRAQGRPLDAAAAPGGAAADSEGEEEEQEEAGGQGGLAPPEDLMEGLPANAGKQRAGASAAARQRQEQQQPEQRAKKRRAQQAGDALLVPHAAAGPALAAASGAAGVPEFLPAPAFAGARQGMIFKKGGRGLGYYRDVAGAAAAAAARAPSQPPPAQPQARKEKKQQRQAAGGAGAERRGRELQPQAAQQRRRAPSPSDLSGGDGGSSSDSSGGDRRVSFASRLGGGKGRRKALPGRLRKKLAAQKAEAPGGRGQGKGA